MQKGIGTRVVCLPSPHSPVQNPVSSINSINKLCLPVNRYKTTRPGISSQYNTEQVISAERKKNSACHGDRQVCCPTELKDVTLVRVIQALPIPFLLLYRYGPLEYNLCFDLGVSCPL